MKSPISAIILIVLGFVLVGSAAARAPKQTTKSQALTNTTANATTATAAAPAEALTHSKIPADTIYKNNCTRCHSEVPQTNPRVATTVLRHMRVRANLTQEEAKAILDYITQ